MRAILFWWLFKTMNRDWWARFLDRFGAPFIVGKYNEGDDRSRSELAYAFSQATRIFGLTIPTDAHVDLVQANTGQTGDAFEKFHSVANAEISKLIVGQTMTTEAQAGGIGGTQANVHQGVRDDIQGFDATALAETLRDQLFHPHLAINGFTGPRPTIAFGGQGEADAKATADYMSALNQAGFEPAEDAAEYLSRVGGFPVQRKQATIEAKPIQLDATAGSQLAGHAAAPLSQALRRGHADLPELIRNSASAADLEDRLVEYFHRTDRSVPAELIADVLASHAVNGLDRSN